MKYVTTFCAAVLICTLIIGILPINGESDIYDDVVRLHVIANSDTDEDQALKLKVRDAVLDYVSPLLIDAKDRFAAEETIEKSLPEIEKVAANEIVANGYSYSVRATIGEEKYPEKNYGELSLPAGNYISLRVIIENGEGHNWWCVLFPPVCNSIAMGKSLPSEDIFIAAGFTPEEYRVISKTDTVKYKLKFKLLETVSSIFNLHPKAKGK